MKDLSDASTEDLESELERRKKEDASTLPFVGESINRSRYRITFAPVDGIFSDDDAVRDAIHHSAWGEDREFEDAFFERVESVVTAKDYPYICECGDCVSKTTEGRCFYCGEVKWSKR